MIRAASATATFALLAALSLASVALFETERATLALGLAIFAIALAKIALIANRYMHLAWHHRPFAQAITVWLVGVGAILATGLAFLPWTP